MQHYHGNTTLPHNFNKCSCVEVVCPVELNDSREVWETLITNQELVATPTHNVVAHFCVFTARGSGEGEGEEGRRGEGEGGR